MLLAVPLPTWWKGAEEGPISSLSHRAKETLCLKSLSQRVEGAEEKSSSRAGSPRAEGGSLSRAALP